MKKVILVIILVVSMLLLAGCHKEEAPQVTTLNAPTETVLTENVIEEVTLFEDVTAYW